MDYMRRHGPLLRRRYFQRAPLEDWEDFTQDILLYLLRSQTLNANHLGWRSWIKHAIWCRAKNRVRDAIIDAGRHIYHRGDMDCFLAPEISTHQACAVNETINRFASHTIRCVWGDTIKESAAHREPGRPRKREGRTGRYQQVRFIVNSDRRALREALYAA